MNVQAYNFGAKRASVHVLCWALNLMILISSSTCGLIYGVVLGLPAIISPAS